MVQAVFDRISAKLRGWEKLSGRDWCRLLIDQPQCAGRCNWKKQKDLDSELWDELLGRPAAVRRQTSSGTPRVRQSGSEPAMIGKFFNG